MCPKIESEKINLKANPFIFKYFFIFPINHINYKTFSVVFTGVQVANVYETPDKEFFSARVWFNKGHKKQGKLIEHQFDKVNVNNWAWC
jgi:hypothetical protein